jgi:uncharacterized tellurite resistance protein B-like protein
MNYKKLYIELGKLLYAVAKADGKVQAQEKQALKDIVMKQLAPLESSIDAFGTDQAFYAEFEFETLESFDASSEKALASWIKFANAHPEMMTDNVIKLVFDAVKQIAEAYRGASKPELDIIDRLNEEFKKIKKK